ncbi:MAG: hypothetical protein F6K19_48880 [Cyanothece sp. SIO1E1]|nr:hypothetical protein [Cyanothece sp. SIO1E1]
MDGFLPTPQQNCPDYCSGKAELLIETDDPGNPRDYIDGQIYTLSYTLQGQINSQQHMLDAIYILLFDGYQIPEKPTWIDHIQPIFQQFGNLYPIMSQGLFDLGDYDLVRENRALLELAFSLDIYDPNSMPVTRDLSKAKRATILQWLNEQDRYGNYVLRLGSLKTLSSKTLPDTEEVLIESSIQTAETEFVLETEADEDTMTHGYENFKIALQRLQSDP